MHTELNVAPSVHTTPVPGTSPTPQPVSTQSAATVPISEKAAPTIIYGRDGVGRAHASVLVGPEAERARGAAQLMGMACSVADTDALRTLAARLPKGRIFEKSGRAFVPFVAGPVYAELLAATGTPDEPSAARRAVAAQKAAAAAAGGGSKREAGHGSPSGPGGAGDPPGGGERQRPTDWPEIGPGSLVLACQAPMEGWYEAEIIDANGSDSFVLRWRDWDEPEIVRDRKDLGLLPPNSREGIP